MKYSSKLLLKVFIFISFFAISNCSLNQSEDSADTQTYLFEVEHINQAWGYEHNGFYIDKTGDVFCYNYTDQDEPWNPAARDHFSAAELKNKYSHSKSLCDKVDFITLKEKRLMIPLAMEGNYSDTTSEGADMGTIAFICYKYNSNDNLYTPIILEVYGDYAFKNESAAANNLVKWLGSVAQFY